MELAISWLLDERVELWLYHGCWMRGWNSGYIMAVGMEDGTLHGYIMAVG